MESNKLDELRHSAAHLLAAAVIELWPNTKPTIGPAIDNGFYYDFDFEQPISESDLPKIEQKMREIVKKWNGFERQEVPETEAKEIYKDNPYKLELIDEVVKKGDKLSLYRSGEFLDLCRGGHSHNPKDELRHFKLLSIAGAYWRGDEKNKMLTRIYGTAFPTKDELENHLTQLEESKKRDHRKIGQELELFATSDQIGSGLILWLPKGTSLREEIEKLGKKTEKEYGYMRVSTPHIAKEELFYTSGHLPYYKDDMYPPMKMKEGTYYLKPMNCPHMHMIYKAKPHSYREFPIRYAEFGTVYRNEDSGTLMGLMRVRGLTQNDAHIYCADEKQATEELLKVMEMHKFYYDLFGIKEYYVELALPDLKKKKDKYFDDPKEWAKSIDILRKAASKANVKVVEQEGSAAFYGPKFDFNIKSATGREFGASTNQLDFGSGKRFGLTYIDSDGAEKPVSYIIHRAPLGAHERFIGFLIEHYAGVFPLWLAPVQVSVLSVSEKHSVLAEKVHKLLEDHDIRSQLSIDGKTLGAKIRESTLQKVPYMIIIGDKEAEKAKGDSPKDLFASVRTRYGKDLGLKNINEFLNDLKGNIEKYL